MSSSSAPPPPRSHGRLGAIPGGRPFGRYLLEERIAIGGSAEVFLAQEAGEANAGTAGVRVVIKRLLPGFRLDATAIAMFDEEARLHRLLEHKNIVRCLEVGDAGGEPYLAMEWVPGVDLHRVLRMVEVRKRPLSPPIATYIARELLAALAAVHSATDESGHPLGIVHRDVSPSNIYLSTEGDIKLGDFGIAHAARTRLSRPPAIGTTRMRGKFAYLAPEQVASEPVDHRADLFAAANILGEMLLGKPLFPGAGQLAVLLAIRDARTDALDEAVGVPEPLVALLKRALARNPAERFPTAEALRQALAPFEWPSAETARYEIAQLMIWARKESGELRAIGEHPDQRPAHQRALFTTQATQATQTTQASRANQTSREPPDSERASDDAESRRVTPVHSVPVVHAPTPRGLEHPPTQSPRVDISVPQPASSRATSPFSPRPSHVRTAEGKLVGPFTYAKLVELVATGKLQGEDEVDFMGTGFVPLWDIPELARHIAPRTAPTAQIDSIGVPDWQGSAVDKVDDRRGRFADPGIAAALSYIASRAAKGVLIAQSPTRRKELYFVDGRLFQVASTEPGELIGEYLVARRLIDRSELDFALAVLPRYGGRLGEALAGLGLLDPMSLFRALQHQGRDKVVELFRWQAGDFSFYAGADAGRVEFPLELSVAPIIEHGVAAIFEDRPAMARYQSWLEQKLVVASTSRHLNEGWSAHPARALVIAAAPITVRALLRTLTIEGATQPEAVRAVESLRLARILDWR